MAEVTSGDGNRGGASAQAEFGAEQRGLGLGRSGGGGGDGERKQKLGKVYALDETPNDRNA